jgi:prephenate dehydratase
MGQRVSEIISIGIQGGPGSFNEQALRLYLDQHSQPLMDVKVKYLYTTDRVLSELLTGSIDLGQFAVENSLGGSVEETLVAQKKYSFETNCEVIAHYSLQIAHCLMLHPEVQLEEVKTIMTHPQVLAQCRNNIGRRYPWVELSVGEGDLIDPAKVGEAIARGILPRTVATVSSRLIADIQGLKILDQNLQDREDNFTRFILVRRRQ